MESLDNIFKRLELEFKKVANAELAAGMSRYMKYKFEYYGIKAPLRKKIFAPYKSVFMPFIKNGELESIILQMWEYDQREWQYTALELLYSGKKYFTDQSIDLIERLILSKSWWDTVDMLATKISGYWFLKFPNKSARIQSWIQSPNMWINRSAIIHQMHYKKDTDTELLLESILPHIHSTEFFHRKAIGWALRQYSRTDPDWVKKQASLLPLSNLSKKEALRLMK